MKLKLLLFLSLAVGSIGLSFLFSSPVSATSNHRYGIASSLHIFAGTDAVIPEDTGDTSQDAASQCRVEQIGWIVCPVMNVMASVVDGAYAFVTTLLQVQPLVITGGEANESLYTAWSVMRNFANVAFVIAFMVIIFSQLTSYGLNNYGIKKMLPRLIVAAILVNVSFWICAAAVDVSNILGSSLNGIFQSITVNGDGSQSITGPSITPGDNDADGAATGEGWAGIVGLVLVGTTVGIAAFHATLAALIPALLAAGLAIVTVFLILTLRQALIILLVVISPLAFVAYLLPNTESLFKKWLGLFKTLLLMYPIIAVIFGASALASTIVMNSAEGSTFEIPIQIMGALMSVIPLALTPIIMKTAGGTLNRFGGIVNNPNKGPYDKLRKRAEGYKDFRQGLAKGRRIDRANNFRRGNAYNGNRITSKLGNAVLGNGKVANTLWGDASTEEGKKDRAKVSRMLGGAYEENQKEQSRRDILAASGSLADKVYSESEEGLKHGSEAINAKNRAGTAQTNVAAFAEEQLLQNNRSDLNAARDAKDRQSIAQTQSEAYSEANRGLGAILTTEMSKSRLEQAKKEQQVTIEEVRADKFTVPSELIGTAAGLRSADLAGTVAASQTDAAKRVQMQALHKRVVDDDVLANAMGGVDDYGQQRAQSISKTALVKQFNDAVSEERRTLATVSSSDDDITKTTLTSIMKQDGTTYKYHPDGSRELLPAESPERRSAATSLIMEKGADKDILDAITYVGSADRSTPERNEAISTLQQQLAEDIKKRKPTSLGAGVLNDQLANGTFAGQFEDLVVQRARGGKVNAEAYAHTSADELDVMINEYTANGRQIPTEQKVEIIKSIQSFRDTTNPVNAGRQPTQEIGSRMDKVVEALKLTISPSDLPAFTPHNQQQGTSNQPFTVPHANSNPPTQSPQPSQANPSSQQNTNNTQFNVPHNTSPNNSRTTMPPNTSGYQQSAGGVYMPPSTTQSPPSPQNPPTPPPSNP